MERRKHAELELDLVIGRKDERIKMVVIVFGDLDLEVLLPS